jgi:hypothetical protein
MYKLVTLYGCFSCGCCGHYRVAAVLQMLMMLAGRDPAVLHALGVTQASLQQQLAAHRAAAKWATLSAADKAAGDAVEWRGWLGRYRQRLQQEADAGAGICGRWWWFFNSARLAALCVLGDYLYCRMPARQVQGTVTSSK